MKIRSLCVGLAYAGVVFIQSHGVYAAPLNSSSMTMLAADEHSSVGQKVDDSVITAKVKTALLKPDNGVSGLAVEVTTHDGEVQLSGFVDNHEEAMTAARIAQSVEGVRSVRNSLHVKGE